MHFCLSKGFKVQMILSTFSKKKDDIVLNLYQVTYISNWYDDVLLKLY